MAKVKFYSGTKSKIDSKAIEDGAFYVSTDSDELLTDVNGVRKSLSNKVTWSTLSGKPSTFPPSSHTHSYAGSSSAGGSATSAVKLDSSAGSATQPVYFASGKPTAISYTIGTSVPSGAKFTDTTYGVMKGATASAAGTSGLVPAPAAGKNTSFFRGDGTWVVPTNTTYGVVSTSANGLAPKLPGNTTTYLRGDGRWGTPPNNTYTLGSFGITATAAQINFVTGVTSNIQTQLNGKAASSHTHNYAGSSSAGGAANSAVKANALTVFDTRDVNSLPNEGGFDKNAISADFKQNSTIGTTSFFGGSFCGLLSFAPWSETSGGYGYQMAFGYNGTSPRLLLRAADLSATAWGSWYKIYTSNDKPTLAELGIGNVNNTADSAKNVLSATKLTTARTINGTSFNGTANITTANWGTARTLTIGSTGKSVNGSGNVAWTLSEIGAAAASHSHSYLPLSGGTLSGRLTANGRITMPTVGGSWISGMTTTNASIAISTQNTSGSYHPVIACTTYGGNVWNLGTITESVGFYGFKSGRTKNATDWAFTINSTNGAVSSTGAITAPGFNGNASTATALTTSAGSATQPVYFASGKPVACTYTLGKSVPSNAVFTDTNTTYAAGTGLALSGTTFSIKASGVTATQLASGAATLAKLGSDVGTVAVQSAAPTDSHVKLWIKV